MIKEKGQDIPCTRAEGRLRSPAGPRETPRPRRDPPSVRGRPVHSRARPSSSNAARPQPAQGQLRLDPRGMPGLLQPAVRMDTMQRLALMMAVMILGVPQVQGCNTGAGLRASWGVPLSDVEICPAVTPGREARMEVGENSPDPDDWVKLSAVHCQATQSVLTFL
jgi:hypothetical protein